MADISNDVSNTLISGTEQEDSISNSGSSVTINGGAGNDSISNNGSNVSISGGAGIDTIYNSGAWTELYGDAGDDSISNTGDNVTIDGGEGDDSIYNTGDEVTIDAGAGNDYIDNSYFGSSSVSIDGGEGEDTITNYGDEVTISAGAGNDSIYNSSDGSLTAIDGGEGDDSITNNAANVTITGGAGDDDISNTGSQVTINAGAGDDFIYNSGSNVLFQYEGGNDTIEGFSETSTLQIVSGSVTSVLSNGVDAVLTIGADVLTLKNIGTITNINIVNASGVAETLNIPVIITGTEQADEIYNYTAGATINALGGNDSIYNYDSSNVLIDAGAGNDYIYSTISSYSAVSENVTINAGAGDDEIYYDGSNATINAGAGNDSILSYGSGATINADEGNDYVYNDDNSNTINGGNGNDSIYIANDVLYTTINGGAGDDSIRGAGSVLYQYNVGDGNDIIDGFNGNSTLSIAGGKYSRATINSDIVLTIGDGTITLSNMTTDSYLNIIGEEDTTPADTTPPDTTPADTTPPDTTPADTTPADTTPADTTPPDTTPANLITLTNGNDTYNNTVSGVTIVGGKGNDYISNSDYNDIVIQYNDGDGNDTIVGFNNFSSIQIGNGAGTYSTTKSDNDVIISVGNGSLLLKDAATLDYVYVNGNDVIGIYNSNANTLVSGTEGDDHIENSGANSTINALAGDDNIQNWNDNVTIDCGAGKDVVNSFSGNYVSISGGDGDDLITNYNSEFFGNKGNNVTISGGAGNDTINNGGANVLFQYAEGDGNDTITGFLENSTLSISSHEYSTMVSGDNLVVKVGDGSITIPKTFVFDPTGSNINIVHSKIEEPTWRLNGTTATYGTSNNPLFTVSGVKDTVGLELNDKTVTVKNSALNQSAVTISDGYTLTLADDVDKAESLAAGWSIDANNNAIYQSGSAKIGYKLDNNQISYVAESLAGTTLAALSGIMEDSTLAAYDNGISLAADNFAGNVSVVSIVNRNFELATGDYADREFAATDKIDKINNAGSKLKISGAAGNDKISNSGTGVTINGGAGDDNVTISGETGGNTYVYSSGDGKDILYNFKGNDTIQILDTVSVEADVKNKDAVFTIGKGSITVRDAATSDMTITLIDSDGNALSNNKYTSNGIINDSEILGSSGNDTLISGTGNFSLTGGKGNDLFIYGGGDDTITDYSQSDKISVGSFTATGYELNGDNVVLDFGEDNALTIQNGKGKEITFAGKKSSVRIYEDAGIFDGKKKSLTLAADTNSSFSAAKLSKLITIDGSQVDGELSITGNKKSNYIIAGNNGSTLDGGKGKDTLRGGDGADVFLYDSKSGNKVIENYGEDDIISLDEKSVISQVTTKKGNTVLKVGSNKITIEDAEKFTFTAGGASEPITYDNKMLISDKSITLASDFKDKTFDLNADGNDVYNHISAELGKKAITLIGDAEDNILTGGKGKDTLDGGENDDNLNGGKGNDSLWGGDGADTFVYQAGTGNDIIGDYNFEDGDILQILDKKGNLISKNAIKKATFDDDGDLILSIKGGGKVTLEGVGTSASVNVNGGVQEF